MAATKYPLNDLLDLADRRDCPLVIGSEIRRFAHQAAKDQGELVQCSDCSKWFDGEDIDWDTEPRCWACSAQLKADRASELRLHIHLNGVMR